MLSVAPKQYIDVCPDNVAVIGGGRWARVVTEVLFGLIPPSTKLTVHSRRNSQAMVTWVSNRGLNKLIGVSSCLPSFPLGASNAVIVVNAAHDHEGSVEWALTQGCSVLVEKPLCLNLVSAHRLSNLAFTKNSYLATAHVFLFASYVEAFSKLVSDQNGVISIRVLWMDPKSEDRYGETKSYDPGLPIYADWLPHIASILGTFVVGQPQLCGNLELLRGGAHLNIHLKYNQIPCAIELVRNGDSRQRIIEVVTRRHKIVLDFGCEPGIISIDGVGLCGDPDWNDNPKPVAKMLAAFLKGAAGGIRDARLDMSIGVNATQVIDQTAPLYYAALLPWLNNELQKHQEEMSSDLRYALTEILMVKDVNSSIPIGQRINYVYRHVRKHVMTTGSETKQHAAEAIELIIKQGKISSYL